jgi:hypothetical protein
MSVHTLCVRDGHLPTSPPVVVAPAPAAGRAVAGPPPTAERPAVSAQAIRALEAELGGRAPDGLHALTATQLRAFTVVLHDAKRRQSDALQSAVDEALEIVPRMVRGPVRKILFG